MYYSLFNQDLVDYVYFFCLYARLYLIVVWTDNFHGAIYCGSSPWHCIFIYNVFLDPISFFSSSWWVLILISQLIMAFELMVLSFKPNLTFLSLWDGGISLTSINVRYEILRTLGCPHHTTDLETWNCCSLRFAHFSPMQSSLSKTPEKV